MKVDSQKKWIIIFSIILIILILLWVKNRGFNFGSGTAGIGIEGGTKTPTSKYPPSGPQDQPTIGTDGGNSRPGMTPPSPTSHDQADQSKRPVRVTPDTAPDAKSGTRTDIYRQELEASEGTAMKEENENAVVDESGAVKKDHTKFFDRPLFQQNEKSDKNLKE